MPSANQFVLEICVESVELAIEAQRGGAHRIELCSQLSLEGVTPRPELVQRAREQVSIPLHVMIRPRAGNFFYSDAEFQRMLKEVEAVKRLGVDGIVVGVLKADRTVDVDRTGELVALAYPLSVTFHRAFDHTPQPAQALNDVVRAGAKRILTSGRADRAVNGLDALAQLLGRAGHRVTIMAGGGINEQNVGRIARTPLLREFHCSLSQACPSARIRHPRLFEQRVRALYHLIAAANNRPRLSKAKSQCTIPEE